VTVRGQPYVGLRISVRKNAGLCARTSSRTAAREADRRPLPTLQQARAGMAGDPTLRCSQARSCFAVVDVAACGGLRSAPGGLHAHYWAFVAAGPDAAVDVVLQLKPERGAFPYSRDRPERPTLACARLEHRGTAMCPASSTTTPGSRP